MPNPSPVRILRLENSPYPGRGRTVLVVDDEATVRNALSVILRRLGFTVLAAADGTHALLEFVSHRDEVALIITDVSMPDIDGVAFANTVRRLAPEVLLVMMSGLVEARVRNSLRDVSVDYFLQKPFTQAQLVAMLEAILPASDASAPPAEA